MSDGRVLVGSSGDQRVLVTGAGGRIGRRLLASAPVGWIGTTRETLDVSDRASWRARLAAVRPTVVVHLAGGAAGSSDAELHALNVAPLQLLLAEAEDAGIHRVVLASSAAVYGDRRAHALRESDAPEPLSAYARAKLAAEQLLDRAVADGRLESAVALRIFNVTGPGMTDSLIARLLRSTPEQPVELRGDDVFVRDYVHVDDVAEALTSAATTGLPGGAHVLNVGRGIPVSNRRAVEEVTAARGAAPATFAGTPSPSTSWAEVSEAERVLGFRARRSITADGRPPSPR